MQRKMQDKYINGNLLQANKLSSNGCCSIFV